MTSVNPRSGGRSHRAAIDPRHTSTQNAAAATAHAAGTATIAAFAHAAPGCSNPSAAAGSGRPEISVRRTTRSIHRACRAPTGANVPRRTGTTPSPSADNSIHASTFPSAGRPSVCTSRTASA